MPAQQFLTEEWRERMERIESCRECGQCRSRLPYGLDVSAVLKTMLVEYREVYEAQAVR